MGGWQAVVAGVKVARGDRLEEPGKRAAELNRVKPHRVGVVINSLGGALVENADLRAQGVVGLVVFLVAAVSTL